MAKKPKAGSTAATVAAAPRNLLAEAVSALLSNLPMPATKDEMAVLLNDQRGPLVEFNENATFDGGKIAFRATALGQQVHAASAQPQAGAAWGGAPQSVTTITPADVGKLPVGGAGVKFDDNVPVPAPRRGGRGSGVYGFEFMNVGQSFYIAATADNPNPAKRIASTVSSATKRHAPRKFLVRSVTPENDIGKGARVWRTE